MQEWEEQARLRRLSDRAIRDLAQYILQFQKQHVIDTLISKLADENVIVASDLLLISKENLEMKLYNNGEFNLDEASHTMSLREWAQTKIGCQDDETCR